MIKRFLSYVEIKTKITSVFAFLVTIAFLHYKKLPINGKLTLIFFVSMFLFDLTTTAINNYIDTKTNHQTLQFKRSIALFIIYVLLFAGAGFGLYLVYLTNIIVLFLGALCFLCGILYTYGPIPISRQPYGEILSGLFYGFLIPFILLYINTPKGTYLSLGLSLETITVSINVKQVIIAGLFSVAPFCTTANIMLANNICDLEKDIAVKRYTLPYFLGRKSIYIFAALYYTVYIAVIAMMLLKILSPLCLLLLFTMYPVQKNINIFLKEQDKATTFIVSVKNYVIIMAALSLLIFIS